MSIAHQTIPNTYKEAQSPAKVSGFCKKLMFLSEFERIFLDKTILSMVFTELSSAGQQKGFQPKCAYFQSTVIITTT
jgi:hypothetical protein